MIIDAHHHFWDPARIPQPWMTEAHAAIDRRFEPEELAPLLDAAGIDRTIVVQSAASDADTDYLFELADRFDRVGAVTVWLPLDDARRARRRLAELEGRRGLRAVRHLIHQEPDPHWILRDDVRPGLELLEQAGLLLELPAEFPRHLGDVPGVARRHPGLTIVIDHLAKPPLGRPELGRWEDELRAAAALPNVVAKVSGLNTVAPRGFAAADLEPAVRAAVEAFGPSRLLFGSDWPVALLNGTYGEVVARTIEAIRAAAGERAGPILGANAARLYRIDEP